MKKAPILYGVLQIFLLSTFHFVDNELFANTLGTFYLIANIIFSCIFYGYTAYKDPGFVTIQDYQYTDSSNPYQRKRQSFHPFPGNSQLRTKEQIPDEHVELKDNILKEEPKQINKKKNDEYEMQCEASIDEQNFPDHEIPNATKTPEKSRIPSKMPSLTQSPTQQIRTSQVISQSSTKPDNKIPTTEPPSQQEINIEQQQSPKSAHNEKNTIDQSVHHGNSMFIEKRYCPICNQDQIIRSKHCRKCNRCIALYDHHCPWTSNCIGERNRCVFYWFLVFQLQEISYVLIDVFPKLEFSAYNSGTIIIVVLAILISLSMGLMVISLFLFHSLLSFKNMTTWEYKSWRRISYLKDFPQALGSPFSKGWKENLRLYCRFSVPKLTNWEYNTQIMNFIK